MSNSPIGIFDSGIGGLTVAKAITETLPNESIIYFGDTAHLPYGEKSPDAIRYFCLQLSKFLISKGCKMIVVACNSAASSAYQTLLDFFDGQVMFVNVVDPIVKKVALENYSKVGLIATKVTVGSKMYEKKLKELSPSTTLNSLATPLLVPMIEEGFFKNNISEAILTEYLQHDNLKGIEALILACTHYPLIKKEIESYYDNKITVYDSNYVVAQEVKRLLEEKGLQSNQEKGERTFYVSDYTTSFEETTKLFYKEEIKLEHYPIWTEY